MSRLIPYHARLIFFRNANTANSANSASAFRRYNDSPNFYGVVSKRSQPSDLKSGHLMRGEFPGSATRLRAAILGLGQATRPTR